MNKPDLLSETDKYFLEPGDFTQQLDKFIFSAIYNLYVNGAEQIHAVDIDTYLQQNALAKQLMEKENGKSFLQDCEIESDVSNFNYYYNKLKKFNLVRDLQLSKNDIDNIYCEDILNGRYTEINDNFEKMQVVDIINILKSKVANVENQYVLNNITEESCPADSIKQRVKEWKAKPEIGCMLQGEIFNTITRGGRKGKLYIRSAGSGVGKALPNYTKIPTPNGWKTVGEIKVGDYLFDRFGKSTKVLAIYPQKEKKQVYKVYFKSGRIAECCEEHLWSYYSNLNDKHPDTLITSTLREIIDDPKGLKNNRGVYRWSIPINKPVQYTEKKYSVDPYVMGLILGDGSFRYGNNKSFLFSSSDEELVKAICVKQNYKCYKKNSDYNYNWTFELLDGEIHKKVWVEDILKDYPELWSVKSEEKFIPEDFMFGSIEQRYDLLSGLLDTDGSIDDKGRISFSTISPMLKDNIISLCESLGMICNYSTDIRKEKYTTGECYSVHIQASKEDKIKLFKLKRKLDKTIQYANNEKRTGRRDRDAIIDIKVTDIYTDMTCFYVDNDEHLFLMNDYICTHNTRSMVGDACHIAYPIRYDTRIGKWISTGSCEKVLYVMTEQDTEEIDTMIMAYLTGYNEDVFTYGTFDENDPRIQTAIDIMERYRDNMNYAKVVDPCSSIIKNLFRRRNLQDGIENFFYDYIFSSPAMLDEYRDLKIREDKPKTMSSK